MSVVSAINTVLIHAGDDRNCYVDATDLLPEGRTIESATVTPLNSGVTAGACTVFTEETPVGSRGVEAGKGFYFRISTGTTKGKRDLRADMVLDNGDRLGDTLPLQCYGTP